MVNSCLDLGLLFCESTLNDLKPSKTSYCHLQGSVQLKQLAAATETGCKINGFQVSKVHRSGTKPKPGFSRSCSVFLPRNWKHLINRKLEGKKVVWQIILHGYLCNTLLRFSSKSKAINVFHILRSKGRDQSSQARKKLFCLVIVRIIWAAFHESFLFKIESMWRCKIKEQAPQLTLLYLGMTVRSSHQRCCIRK